MYSIMVASSYNALALNNGSSQLPDQLAHDAACQLGMVQDSVQLLDALVNTGQLC